MSSNRKIDLALEAKELAEGSARQTTRLSGVRAEEDTVFGLPLTRVDILDQRGEQALGKPRGTYLTMELPELPRMPRLPALRHRGQREEAPAWEREEPETAAETESVPEEPVVYTVDDILQEMHSQPAETAYVPKRMEEPERVSAPEPEKQVAPVSGSGAAVWQKMLDDPEKLAGDLEKLTQALQGLSADLRRSAEESRKEDDR